MKFVAAVKGETKDDDERYSFRIVFKPSHGYVVYKGFADTDSVWTVKYWNTEDLKKTMSYWNTKKQFVPTKDQISLATKRIRTAGADIVHSN